MMRFPYPASKGFGLKAALAAEPGVGAFWFATGSVATVELAAGGAQAAILDLQHGLFDRPGLEQAIAAIPAGVFSIARVAECSERAIGEALDAGAGAIMVPLVETAEQARAAVAFARYPPEGIRSGGGVRPVAA